MNSNEMSPIDWAKRPITEKYADFRGRAPRAEYWWFYLAYLITYIIASIVDSIVGTWIFRLLVVLAAFLPMLGASVRRLHDTNRTGWWLLGPIVPYAIAFALLGPSLMSGGGGLLSVSLGLAGLFLLLGAVCAIVLLVFMVLPGTPGENRYGPNPYGAGEAVTAAQ